MSILTTRPENGYKLLDSGDGEKLESFGPHVLRRPDPQVIWPKRLPESAWNDAAGSFSRNADSAEWDIRAGLPDRWPIDFAGLKFWIRPTAFKHTGLFPEQAANWEWLKNNISARAADGGVEVLNLFAYTGGATLACAQAGASCVHIDGSKAAVAWARENAELSGLAEKPIRWIVEDARIFVEREIRRGRRYDGIIMDPPAFGHGPANELWKIEEDLLPLMANCFKLLKDGPTFILVNGYAAGYSHIAYGNALRTFSGGRGNIETGELTIEEAAAPSAVETASTPRMLPCGIYARISTFQK